MAALPLTFLKVKDYENEAGFKPPEEKTSVAAVMKAKRGNIKAWRTEEWDGNRDSEGYTCRQRVFDMKALHMYDPKRFPISKFVYNDLKLFKNNSSPREIARAS